MTRVDHVLLAASLLVLTLCTAVSIGLTQQARNDAHDERCILLGAQAVVIAELDPDRAEDIRKITDERDC